MSALQVQGRQMSGSWIWPSSTSRY